MAPKWRFATSQPVECGDRSIQCRDRVIHTSQVTGTTADGEPVVIGLDRVRDEDGTVEDSIYVDIGEIGADDIVSLAASGPEGLVDFGDASVSAQGVDVAEFGSDPVSLSISFDC